MIIIDDFLPKDKFETLSEFVLSDRFPWFYNSHVSIAPWDDREIQDPMAKETDGWYHFLYSENEYNGVFMKDFMSFFEELTARFNYTDQDLIRARLGLKQPKINHKDENYNLPHVDYYFPHDTIIYYLNDSDGDTRMFKEYANNDIDSDPVNFSVENRITPKANRLLLFNGLQYHTASNPINTSRRVVLNVNLKCR
jgi:hypothetical protein